ncbi:Protein F29B9.1 [Aphelenchoides avenae]|nr:Protein F29B9.1 [Aphelenchus avenae]
MSLHSPTEGAFEDSALGTKEYWDRHYETELCNFEETGDEGEVWFGRSAENRMLRFLVDKVPRDAAIIDLGTGNGSVLRNLRLKGFTNLCGVDYCDKAVELARRTAETEKGPSDVTIEFKAADLIAEKTDPNLRGRFDVVLDKGTWDAISLAGDRTTRLKNYRRTVVDLFRTREPGVGTEASAKLGLFVIFSCNFTKDELIDLFESSQDLDLKYEQEIPATSMLTFAGGTGVTSTGVVFRKE